MTRHVSYEWDVETVAGNTPGDENSDILDHYHADKLREYPADVLSDATVGTFRRLVLVRDNDDIGGDRLWAYVRADGTLPECFADAWGTETEVRVPKRFHDELRQWWESHRV